MENWYARPVFFVRNCKEAIEFYKAIGFHEKWKSEEDGRVVAAQINLNGIEVILNENDTKCGKGRIFVSLELGEVEEYLSYLPEGKVKVKDRYWGMPTKSIEDQDGNEILFYDDSLTDN